MAVGGVQQQEETLDEDAKALRIRAYKFKLLTR